VFERIAEQKIRDAIKDNKFSGVSQPEAREVLHKQIARLRLRLDLALERARPRRSDSI